MLLAGLSSRCKRSAAVAAGVALVGMLVVIPEQVAQATTSPCQNMSTPVVNSTVTCATPGTYSLFVPSGTTSVGITATGAGGSGRSGSNGGNAGEVTGTATLPNGTTRLYVIVGAGGIYNSNFAEAHGGGGSAVIALDANGTVLSKLVIAGAGGGAGLTASGGDAGSAGGTSDSAQGGQPGSGATGGARGFGPFASPPATAGGSDTAGALTIASGGLGGQNNTAVYGGDGGAGYGGGGGGGVDYSVQFSSYRGGGGGGGSSYADSSYVTGSSVSVVSGTGGTAVNTTGSNGSVVLTINGPVAPSAPVISASPGNGQATVSFTAPADNGYPITAYEVSTDGGSTWAAWSPTITGSSVSGVVTGLTNGTTYSIEVRADSSAGTGSASNAVSVTPATVPGAPTGVSASPGDGQATVSFTAPVSNGGSAITGYTATSSPGSITGTCSTSPCTVTGLTNGTSYTFTVHAFNSVGLSAESSPSSGVTPVGAPGAPTGVSAVRGNGQAVVSFTAPVSNGGSVITGYTATSSPGSHTGTCSTSPCTVTGLTNGTVYTFTVHATNAAGNSVESAASTGVTPATVPSAPQNILATAGNASATVMFTAAPSTGGSPVTGYTVTSSPGGLTGTCSSSPCVVTGLTNGTSYTFTVHATNAVGSSGESPSSSAVTPAGPPAAPTGLATIATDTTLTVSFTPGSDGGSAVTGYQVSTDGGSTWVSLSVTGSSSSASGVVTGLTAGTTYQVEVRAINGVGTGAASAAFAASTLPAAVIGPIGAVAGVASVTVTWAASGTSGVTGYTVYADPGPATCTTVGLSSTTCVIGAVAGTPYTYTVVAHGPTGDSAASAASGAVTASAPPVPATAPMSAPATLTTTSGVLTDASPSEQITVVGTGFAPYSTVEIVTYSSPIVLGTAVADGNGNVTKLVTVPASLEAGDHNLVAVGVGPSGLADQARMPFVVLASAKSSSTLAGTGTAVVQLSVWGVLLTAAGAALVQYARRRPIR